MSKEQSLVLVLIEFSQDLIKSSKRMNKAQLAYVKRQVNELLELVEKLEKEKEVKV